MKEVDTQIARSLESDFENNTWTFLMPDGFQVWAGEFAIVDKQVYDKLIEKIELFEKRNYQLQEGRDYLMCVQPKEFTIEKTLEAFGFGCNGLL